MTESVGCILGTKEATPLKFWVKVNGDSVLRLDDVVEVRARRPDSGEVVRFFGVVDYVRTLMEGASLDSDTSLAASGIVPAEISYAAQVQVTRIEPEEYFAPQPGESVEIAQGESLREALYFDTMEQRIPAGLMRNGSPVYLNYEFINGEKGAHINISGISGVATKTSFALFLLYSIFHAEVLGTERANTKAIIFNVKGEDLFFLDKENASLDLDNRERYQQLDLPVEPFRNVRFAASPKPGTEMVQPNLNQRAENIHTYLWSLREVCRENLFRFLFAGDDLERGNLGFLVNSMSEKLFRLAQKNDKRDRKNNDEPGSHLETDEAYRSGKTKVETFGELIDYLDFKLLLEEEGGGDWFGRTAPATAEALIRRLAGIKREMSTVIRGDLPPEEIQQYQFDPLDPAYQLSIVDINKLPSKAQKFVVGVLLQKLFLEKEKRGQNPVVFIVLDELNKYAPREGQSPIKDLLVEIAERGRSLGIILIGAQQTASEVERRVVGQAAIRVVGRLDSAEAERSEYNFLGTVCRQRSLLLKSGSMFVQQPQVPTPLLVQFPFPPYATRRKEVGEPEDQQEKLAEALSVFDDDDMPF
ncbi:MAG: ATP-binding protein [Cyanobacteria bacterium P01_H01_bin.15]